MDIREYIASGIIDSYVLGSVSSQERQEVQCLSKIYPEIAEEVQRAEQAMEAYAESIAIQPPQELKESILSKIKGVAQDAPEDASAIATPTTENSATENEAEKETKIIPISGYYKWAVAASILIIVGMTFMYTESSNSKEQLEKKYTALKTEANKNQESLEQQLAFLETSLNSIMDREAFITAPNTRKLALSGTDVQPNANATIYWDESTGDAILASNGMPQPDAGKQFQLWAIADGKPVDLGVIEKDSTYSSKIQVNLANVQAFAITLEKDGGSPTPTLEQLYVIGNV